MSVFVNCTAKTVARCVLYLRGRNITNSFRFTGSMWLYNQTFWLLTRFLMRVSYATFNHLTCGYENILAVFLVIWLICEVAIGVVILISVHSKHSILVGLPLLWLLWLQSEPVVLGAVFSSQLSLSPLLSDLKLKLIKIMCTRLYFALNWRQNEICLMIACLAVPKDFVVLPILLCSVKWM